MKGNALHRRALQLSLLEGCARDCHAVCWASMKDSVQTNLAVLGNSLCYQVLRLEAS